MSQHGVSRKILLNIYFPEQFKIYMIGRINRKKINITDCNIYVLAEFNIYKYGRNIYFYRILAPDCWKIYSVIFMRL